MEPGKKSSAEQDGQSAIQYYRTMLKPLKILYRLNHRKEAIQRPGRYITITLAMGVSTTVDEPCLSIGIQ